MAFACDRYGKTFDRGNKVSHAKNRSKTLRMPNLHRANVLVDGIRIKMRLCTKCQRIVRATMAAVVTAKLAKEAKVAKEVKAAKPAKTTKKAVK